MLLDTIQHQYHFQWLINIEESLVQKKHLYYTLLEQNDATEFITIILEIIYEESERLKGTITTLTNPKKEDFL